MLLYLFLTQNNHKLKFLVRQNGEMQIKLVIVSSKWRGMKIYCFTSIFSNRTLFFSFSFANIGDLE